MQALTQDDIQPLICLALAEDVGGGDVTTLATVPEEARSKALLVAREPLVVAGLAVAEAVFAACSPGLAWVRRVHDGEAVPAGAVLLEISGPSRALLTAERCALNFLQRLCGVATLTASYVAAVSHTQAKILDTRKTTPGWRRLEKYAVACGGGHNHRMGLFDMVLIKDNHLVALRDARPNPIAAAVQRAREKFPGLRVEVEADSMAQVEQAIEAGADIILLDNMSLELLGEAVAKTRGRCLTEASGGVNLQTVGSIAETGVDFISVGALTHSSRAMDIALDFVEDHLPSPNP